MLGLALMGVTACAAEAPENAPDDIAVRVEPKVRIFGGESDDKTTSVIALKVAHGDKFELCSGALVAPNVVLTARHCVIESTTTTVSCDENGRSANGRHVERDLAPTDVTIYTGEAPDFGEEPNAIASAFVTPPGDYLCDSDIALVVLDRPIEGAPFLPVRLTGTVSRGETIRSVGYGQTDRHTPLGTRQRRGGVKVLAKGAGISESRTALGAHEFEVGESICEGDSGGPAISELTGAIVGVVSRGGGCSESAGHIYTATAGWNGLFEQAFTMAGASPSIEVGTPVATEDDTDDAPQLQAPGPNGASCASSPSRPHGLAGLASVFVGLLLLRLRRRP